MSGYKFAKDDAKKVSQLLNSIETQSDFLLSAVNRFKDFVENKDVKPISKKAEKIVKHVESVNGNFRWYRYKSGGLLKMGAPILCILFIGL